MSKSNRDFTEAELQDVSRLADGTLDPARHEEVQSRIASSPQLSALYEREQAVVEALHAAARRERAPAGLRARIEAERTPAAPVRWRAGYASVLAGALAAAVLAVVLIVSAGSPGVPSVSQAARLAFRGAAAPPPAPDPSAPRMKLGRDIEGVYFPNWSTNFHWVALGQRTDRLDGRLAVTVYYGWHGKRVAYTIVSSPALPAPQVAATTLDGTEFRTFALQGRTVLTWRRLGDTCILSGAGVPTSELQKLAAWKVPGVTD